MLCILKPWDKLQFKCHVFNWILLCSCWCRKVFLLRKQNKLLRLFENVTRSDFSRIITHHQVNNKDKNISKLMHLVLCRPFRHTNKQTNNQNWPKEQHDDDDDNRKKVNLNVHWMHIQPIAVTSLSSTPIMYKVSIEKKTETPKTRVLSDNKIYLHKN